MAVKDDRKLKIVADNRKARFNYEIGETFEAGIALTGTEVKSLRRQGDDREILRRCARRRMWLVNANIPEYLQAGRFNHAPKRPRKLLLHAADRQAGRRGRARGHDARSTQALFQRERPRQGRVALARGKKLHDKRETEKKRTWDRERSRLMRMKG